MTLVAGIDSSTQSCKIVVCEADSGRVVRTTPRGPSGGHRGLGSGLVGRLPGGREPVRSARRGRGDGGRRPAARHGHPRRARRAGPRRAALERQPLRPGRGRPDRRAGWSRSVGECGRQRAGRLDDGVEDPLAGSLRAGERRPHGDGDAAARLADLGDRRPLLRSRDRPRRCLRHLLLRCDRERVPPRPDPARHRARSGRFLGSPGRTRSSGTRPTGSRSLPAPGTTWPPAWASELERGTAVVSLGTSGTAFTRSEKQSRDPTGTVAGFADASGEFLPLVCTLNGARNLVAIAELLGIGLEELSQLASAGASGQQRRDVRAVPGG